MMRWLPIAFVLTSGCGGGDASIDPTAIDVLVLAKGSPAAARDVTLIGSDGMVQTVKTDGSGHAIAMLGIDATQATVVSDSASPEGKFTMQGVVPGDHVCLGCTFQTTACGDLPQITNLHRDGTGWSWTLTGATTYAGMEISWLPAGGNPNGAGHLISAPGATSASTMSSADITIKILSRPDLASYADLKTLSRDGWSGTPFCAIGAHSP